MSDRPADDILKRMAEDRRQGRLRELSFYLELGSEAEAEAILRCHAESSAMTRGRPPRSGSDSETIAVFAPGARVALESFGPYRLLQELGRGGQGTVHLAEDTRLGRKVALKVLSGRAADSAEGLLRFRREAEAASRLDDPGICTVYETGEIDGLPFIAMQYIEGESLAVRIRARQRGASSGATDAHGGSEVSSTRRDLDDWVLVVEQIARSLHRAHEKGFVHRDVKPANIMLTPEGRPVILDFGLARNEDQAAQGLTQTGDVLGTPAYMAPEQILGRVHEIDRRSDVYALGVTLYECLVGQRPFAAPTREALYRQIVAGSPPPPSRSDPHVPRDLDVIVLTALERDPDRRYQSAEALADDLRRFRAREPIAARPAGPLLRLLRWAERNPALATALALLFLFLSIGLVVTTSLWRRSETAREEAEQAKLRADRKTLEAQANLRDYEMLSDLQRFEDYVEEIEMLYPPAPARLPAIRAWIARVEQLRAQKEEHEGRLGVLRAQARERSLADVVAERPDENVDLVVDLDRRLAELAVERARAADDPARLAELDRLEGKLRGTRERVAGAIIAAHRHRFDDVATAWKHLNLERLVRSIESLEVGDPSPMRQVLLLENQCEKVAALSLEGEGRAAWSRAIARIAEEGSPYRGLAIEPQLGLFPLGPDPRSGLEEFAQVLTGKIPARDAAGRLVLEPGFALVMVLLPGGEVEIVFDTADRPQARPGPRRARLAPFFVSKYEMTIAQWEEGTKDVLRNPPGIDGITQADHDSAGEMPVTYLAWEIASRFMRRLGLQLPSEVQWEYAARAGEAGRWPDGDEPARLGLFANLANAVASAGAADPFEGQAPVGRLEPNAFGIHDALGNVWELTRDGLDVDEVPLMPGDGLHSLGGLDAYVIRGGGYRNESDLVRFDIRASIDRSSSTRSVGLRPIRPVLAERGR